MVNEVQEDIIHQGLKHGRCELLCPAQRSRLVPQILMPPPAKVHFLGWMVLLLPVGRLDLGEGLTRSKFSVLTYSDYMYTTIQCKRGTVLQGVQGIHKKTLSQHRFWRTTHQASVCVCASNKHPVNFQGHQRQCKHRTKRARV